MPAIKIFGIPGLGILTLKLLVLLAVLFLPNYRCWTIVRSFVHSCALITASNLTFRPSDISAPGNATPKKSKKHHMVASESLRFQRNRKLVNNSEKTKQEFHRLVNGVTLLSIHWNTILAIHNSTNLSVPADTRSKLWFEQNSLLFSPISFINA